MDEITAKRLKEVKTLNVGGPPADSMVSLCIYADDLDPDVVSGIVKSLPSQARRIGESDPDRPKAPPARTGGWILEAPEDLPFVDKINFILDSTTEDQDAWVLLAGNHDMTLRAAIFLRSWTEGFHLPNPTIGRFSRRGWSFSLSMYSAEGDEVIDAFLGVSSDREHKCD